MEDRGEIPAVVIFGDYYQLPPPTLGAIDSLLNQGKNRMPQNASQQFINLGRMTVELTKKWDKMKNRNSF
jgi:hypothetical protein